MICKTCDWYYVLSDEKELVDYCMRRDLYGNILENMLKCYYFQNVFVKEREDRGGR